MDMERWCSKAQEKKIFFYKNDTIEQIYQAQSASVFLSFFLSIFVPFSFSLFIELRLFPYLYILTSSNVYHDLFIFIVLSLSPSISISYNFTFSLHLSLTLSLSLSISIFIPLSFPFFLSLSLSLSLSPHLSLSLILSLPLYPSLSLSLSLFPSPSLSLSLTLSLYLYLYLYLKIHFSPLSQFLGAAYALNVHRDLIKRVAIVDFGESYWWILDHWFYWNAGDDNDYCHLCRLPSNSF